MAEPPRHFYAAPPSASPHPACCAWSGAPMYAGGRVCGLPADDPVHLAPGDTAARDRAVDETMDRASGRRPRATG